MDIIVPDGTPKQDLPGPCPCPSCGLAADNAVTVRSELTNTATFCCTSGHLFALVWSAVA